MTTAGLAPAVVSARETGKVVVVGGGFAGATCARELKRLDPGIDVTLVETGRTFTACPMSSEVVIGLRELRLAPRAQRSRTGVELAGPSRKMPEVPYEYRHRTAGA